MKHNKYKILVALLIASMSLSSSMAQTKTVPNWRIDPDKELNPNTKWLREAKWGIFTHYTMHPPNHPIPGMNAEKWNEKVNSFQVEKFADQLESLKVPYFFITIAHSGGVYCTPNSAFEKHFGPSNGKLSDRDLIADLGKELTSRGIKLGVYLPPSERYVNNESRRQMFVDMVTEWSERWGELVSAWWLDGAKYEHPEYFKLMTDAFKSGNPKAIVAYNGGPVGMDRRQLVPATEYEDYLAGECDYILPTSSNFPEVYVERKIFSPLDHSGYYRGPNIAGDQLHFLTFMGSWWGYGEPRFPDELVIGWTKHINNNSGTVSWDVPLSNDGIIQECFYNQLKALSEAINKN